MEFIDRLKNIFNLDKIRIIEYTSENSLITYECLSCRTIYKYANSKQLLSKISLCRKCYLPFTRWSRDTVQQRLNKLFPESQITLQEFTTIRHGGTIKCEKCGKTEHINNFEALFIGRKDFFCFQCEKNSHTIYDHMQNTAAQQDLIIMGWRGVNNKVKFKCNKCNQLFEVWPSKNFSGICPICQKTWNKWSVGQAEKQIQDLFGDEYQILSFYSTNDIATIKHKCGCIFRRRYADFIRSKGCPKCKTNRSKGEQIIEAFLQQMRIPFVSQKRFSDLPKYSFDFMVLLNDQMVLIEFNGRQHYEETYFFTDTLETIQKRDQIKQQYCLDRGIPLIIIPYSEMNNIPEFLTERFNDYLNRE